MEAARKPDDPRLAELVGDLSIKDPQFRQWWAGTYVALKRRGTRTYDHPVVGGITLDWDALTSDAEPDQQTSSTPRNRDHLPNRRFETSRHGRRSGSRQRGHLPSSRVSTSRMRCAESRFTTRNRWAPSLSVIAAM